MPSGSGIKHKIKKGKKEKPQQERESESKKKSFAERKPMKQHNSQKCRKT